MNNVFGVPRHICLVCRNEWCTCNTEWSVEKIEDCPTSYLQTVVNNCFEGGVVAEECVLVEAIAMELLHRTRYNLDPSKRFTGDVSHEPWSHYNHGVPEVEE